MRKAMPAALILLLLLLRPAVWAQAPTPAPPAKPPTEAEVRTLFAAEDAVRAAAKEGTEERARAARKEEPLARFIAWQEFDAGHYDEAASWFARRGALEHETYVNEVVFRETTGKAESDKTIATMDAACEKMRARLATGTDPKVKAVLQTVVDGIPEMDYNFKHTYLASVEMWLSLSGDNSQLLQYYQQDLAAGRAALLTIQAAGLPQEKRVKMQNAIARTLEQVGDAQERLADFDAAEKTYREALALRRSLPEDDPERDIPESLNDLAKLRDDRGDLPGARAFYEQALQALEDNQPALQKALAAGPTPEQAGLPQKDIDESLGVHRQSLLLSDIESRGLALNNLGSVMQDMGDYKAALEDFGRAIAVMETMPTDGALNQMAGSNVLASAKAGFLVKYASNVATAHADSGAVDQAIQEELQVLDMDKRLGEEVATDLVNLGSLYHEKGDDGKARQYEEQARQEFAAAQNLRGVIGAALGLASLASDAGLLPTAADSAQQALSIARKLGDQSWRGSAARNLAAVRLKQGNLDEADTLLAEAEAADVKVGAPLSQENTADLEGRVLEARGKPEAALAKYKAAIGLLEGVRATTASAADFSNLKSSYRVYERIVTLLLKMGRTQEAFDYYNRAGSARLQDSLRRSGVKTHDPALQALLDRIQGLQVQQKTLTAQLQEERAKPLAQQDPAKVHRLLDLVEADRKAFFRLVDGLKRDHPDLYRKVVPFEPETLDKAQASIPPDVAVIEYAPLGDQLYVFVATHDGVKPYHVAVKPDEVVARIKAVREQMTSPESAAPAVRGTAPVAAPGDAPAVSLTDNLAALYDMLIAPIAADVAGKKTLAFIPTQSLFYLPMQALGRKEGGGLHYLIQDKQIVYLAGADVLTAVADPAVTTRGAGLIAFGNPTGANLPHAQAEVEAIGRLFPTSTVYAGAQATKEAFQDPKIQDAAILHFATHGRLNGADPNKSYVFLANGDSPAGQLTFEDIRMMLLDKTDLVTLSACETALQGQDPSGTEVASLAEAFSSAHVHTVVASLWSVSDESTQTLMVAFYKNLAAGQSKAAALRSAQLQLLNDPRTQHPYYWAPFILMGDWK